MSAPLWTVEAMAAGDGRERAGRAAAERAGAFDRHAAPSQPGEAFFALKDVARRP